MLFVTRSVNYCHNRHHILGDAKDNSIGKTPRETPARTQTPVTQPVPPRIRQQVLNRGYDIMYESLAQSCLAFFVPRSGHCNVRQNLRPDIQPELHRFNKSAKRALASSQGMEVSGWSSSSRKRSSIIAFSATVSLAPSSQSS